MTNEHITLLTQITDALLEVCDGAQEQDAQGFNKPDSLTVRSSYPDMVTIAPLLRKYRKQLEAMGYNFHDVMVLVNSVMGPRLTHNWNEHKIEFGKHSGRTYVEMADDQRGYLSWMAQTFKQDDTRWIAANAVLSEMPIPELKAPEPQDETIGLVSFKSGMIGVQAPFSAKDRCKALSERRWEKPHWVCPAAIIEEVAAAFPDGEQSEGFQKQLAEVRAISEKATQTESDFSLENFGNGKELMPFQKAGLEFAEVTGGNCLISDQMGLGKTIQALSYLALHPEMRPAVIVCPASLKLNWQREAEAWLETDDRIEVINGGKVHELTKDYELRAGIVIINYDILKKWLLELKRIQPEVLILDESHTVKNPKAARSKAAKELAAVVPHKILLTGTPVLNRPKELRNQLEIIDPFTYNSKSWFSWHKRYTNATKSRFGWDFSGASNLDELAASLKTIMIRRTKEQVLPELPAKRRSTVLIPIDNRKEYDRADNEFLEWMAEQKAAQLHARSGFESAIDWNNPESQKSDDARTSLAIHEQVERASHVEQLAKIEYLRQIAVRGKMKQALAWIENFLESGEKLVVFATHKETIHALEREYGTMAVKIDGSVSSENRQKAVDAFQNDPDVKLFIGNIQAAGVGITLTAASNVVFLELGWTPALHEQAEDRCVVEGQPIMTVEGWKPIEAIQVGDYIIAGDGSPHQVIDAWNRLARSSHAAKSKDIVEIHVRGWQEAIKVTSGHRILTVRGWVEAQNIRPRDQILMPSRVVGGGLDELHIHDKYRCASTFETPQHQIFGDHYAEPRIKPATEQKNARLIKLPDTIDLTDIAMFTFGYYIGDGHAYAGQDKGRYVSFAGNKTTKLPRMKCIQHWINSYSINGTIYNDLDSEGCELRMYSSELAKFFAGEFGAKLKEKRVPEWIYTTSFEQRISFLNGWLASDGYVRCKGGCERNEIITASYRLAADVSRLLISLGKKPCVNYGKQAQAYTIGWTDGTAQSLVVTSTTHRTCTKTERIYDLTVKGESSFVVGTAIVHNCHRIGQDNNAVNIYYLLAEKTIDASIAAMLENKREVIDQITEEADGLGFDLFDLVKEA